MKSQHISSLVTQAWCLSLGISLLSNERELMRAGEPGFISEKCSSVSLKNDGYVHTHIHTNSFQPCCLQEQTSAFTSENDQIVPVGILVGKMCTSRAQALNGC